MQGVNATYNVRWQLEHEKKTKSAIPLGFQLSFIFISYSYISPTLPIPFLQWRNLSICIGSLHQSWLHSKSSIHIYLALSPWFISVLCSVSEVSVQIKLHKYINKSRFGDNQATIHMISLYTSLSISTCKTNEHVLVTSLYSTK